MREIRLYGSEGGGAARSPYPYPGQSALELLLYKPEGSPNNPNIDLEAQAAS